ncbi:MAG: DUF4915 domain-containing protein [Pseudomonadota bacterium]
MKADIPFSQFQDVSRLRGNRSIVLWGAGNICTKTLRKLNESPVAICDNSANMWGGEQSGIKIISPENFKTLYKDHFVIICTTSFSEVSFQLIEYGLKPEKDFCVSPILNDLRIIDELEKINTKILLTSGAQPVNDPYSGGGVYELSIEADKWHYKKLFSGCCHSIIEVKGSYYTVDDEMGIIEFDQNYRVVRNQTLPTESRGHGIAYDKKTQHFFIACSLLDAVLVFDESLSLIKSIPLSIKAGRDEGPFHHTNDCCVVGDSLYVSMFSETGNWKRDIFDGAVVEFDIQSGEKVGTPIKDLWMPHNIMFIDGCLTVLDSLRGGLRQNNASTIGQFSAFTRGLAYNGHLFFVGQSRNRNFSKNVGLSKNISIDTGVVAFDPITKVSRFFQLPSKLSEIHGLLII